MRLKFALVPILLIAGFVLQACGQKNTSAQASCSFVTNAEQQRVSWGANVPVVLYIDSAVPSQYYDAIHAAAAEWNTRIGREVLQIGGVVTTNGVPVQDGKNIIYFLNQWEPSLTNQQARTTIYWSGDRIYEADVRVNREDFTFSVGPNPAPGEVDFQSLMTHEFGHVLGLEHTVTPQSVMVKSLPSDTLRRELSATDEKSIRCEY